MELRNKTHWLLVLWLLAASASQFGALFVRDRPTPEQAKHVLLGVVALGSAALGIWANLAPARIRIDEHGMHRTWRRAQVSLAWSEIEAVILHQPPPDYTRGGDRRPSARLLVIPANGVDPGRPLHAVSPLDGRPCLKFVDVAELRTTPNALGATLIRLSSGRFVDARVKLHALLTPPAFDRVPLGYDPASVDDAIRRGRALLGSTQWWERRVAAAELRPPHPMSRNGYDPRQVDEFTVELSAALAFLPAMPHAA